MKGCPHNGDKPLNGKRYCSSCFIGELRRIWYPKPGESSPENSALEVDDMAKKKAAKKQAAKPAPSGKPKKTGHSLAEIIDPFLLKGGHTVKDIAEVLAKKGGEAAKGRDLAANVRARMVAYTRKGYRVEKDEQKHIKVVAA